MRSISRDDLGMTPRGREVERREVDPAFKLPLPRVVRAYAVSIDPSVHVRACVDDSRCEPRFPACNRRIDRAILRIATPITAPRVRVEAAFDHQGCKRQPLPPITLRLD